MQPPDLGLGVKGFKPLAEHVYPLIGGNVVHLYEVPGIAEQEIVATNGVEEVNLLTKVSFAGATRGFTNAGFDLLTQPWLAYGGVGEEGRRVVRHEVTVLFKPGDQHEYKVLKVSPSLHRSNPDPEFDNHFHLSLAELAETI
jgi:hypothetical protein